MSMKNWILGVIGVIFSFCITVIVVWYLRSQRENITFIVRTEKGIPEPELDKPIVIEVDEPIEADDLTRIEGIGPKISLALQDAGISTYAALATMDTEQLKGVLKEAGLRVAVSASWSEQAGLAAAGDWDALEELQASLQGGRRID